MSLHPNLTHLAALVGTWRGDGHGEYPTITNFDYTDEWTFTDIGKPFLLVTERTWSPTGAPMHTETGYLRAPTPETVELVIAIPTGQAEIATGTCAATPDGLTLDTDGGVANTPTAKQVDRNVRRFVLDGDTLTYTLRMAAVGQGLALHLTAHLHRV